MKKLLYIILSIVNCQLYIVESQWIQQSVPVTKPITGIKFINANTGWALSSSTSGIDTCHILYTSNGGTNWVIQYTATSSMFLALSVIDANIIYAGGISSGATANLHKTTNGGVNWSLIPTPTNMSILDMQFLNKDSGWTVGGSIGADVRTTTNGGINWIVRTSGIAAQTQKIFFINYHTGYCGANFNLYKTTNAGLNWDINIVFSETVQSIYFLNSTTGWLGLSATGSARVAYTSNAGANWTNQFLQPYNLNITDIYTVNNQIVYASIPGGLGKIYKSTNGGLNWGYQNINSGSYKISFIDTAIGWSGNNGISKTTNGGGNITFVGINNVSSELPNSFNLYQNYPNPFNPMTTINFDIAKTGNVKLIVFDILGRVISELVNEQLSAGKYEYIFEAENLSSGTYFYKLITEGHSEIKKMILLK